MKQQSKGKKGGMEDSKGNGKGKQGGKVLMMKGKDGTLIPVKGGKKGIGGKLGFRPEDRIVVEAINYRQTDENDEN